MAQNYTEKEICVFNGIMALCKEDKKIYNVTVQDIANAAGVGKGTLYEYFSSKEDIIIRAMMFFLDRENTKAQQIADSGMDFKGKVYGLYDLIIQSFADGFAMANRFVSSDQMVTIPQILANRGEYIDQVMIYRNQLVLSILGSGVAEGLISLDFDKEYIEMAILANLACINQCVSVQAGQISYSQIEQKKSIAYTLLLKSLNH